MRQTKVLARMIARVRQSRREGMPSPINDRLLWERIVVQEHLETFKQLADK